MTTYYLFETQLVFDANNPPIVLTGGATVTLYDPGDTAMSNPLVITDGAGMPMANPVNVSPQGFLPPFRATLPQVRWVGGGYSGYLSSYQGLLDAALAAQHAAEAVLVSGVPTAGTAGQVLAKASDADYATVWRPLIVIIGPSDAWPTGLPDGTLVIRTGT